MPDDEIIEDGGSPQVTAQEKPKLSSTTRKFKDTEIIYVLTLTKGDVPKAAAELKVTEAALRERIEGTRDIKGAWNLIKTTKHDLDKPLGATFPPEELMARDKPGILMSPPHGEGRGGPSVEIRAEEMRRQELEILNTGFKAAGVKDATLDKLRNLSGINLNTGKFLVATLDLSHRMMIYQTIQLLEEADFIKQTYLRDMQLSEEDRLGWQRQYNEICDILGKTFDRTLAGTQAMVVLMGNAPGGKGKPGRKAWQTTDLLPKPVAEDGQPLPRGDQAA